jgi:hypothetical protein
MVGLLEKRRGLPCVISLMTVGFKPFVIYYHQQQRQLEFPEARRLISSCQGRQYRSSITVKITPAMPSHSPPAFWAGRRFIPAVYGLRPLWLLQPAVLAVEGGWDPFPIKDDIKKELASSITIFPPRKQ